MDPKVGTRVRLRVPRLGNPAGTFGICYEVYRLSDRPGASFIFKNGSYDGFSDAEQREMLDFVDNTNLHYNFTNVMTLTSHHRQGIFSVYLEDKL